MRTMLIQDTELCSLLSYSLTFTSSHRVQKSVATNTSKYSHVSGSKSLAMILSCGHTSTLHSFSVDDRCSHHTYIQHWIPPSPDARCSHYIHDIQHFLSSTGSKQRGLTAAPISHDISSDPTLNPHCFATSPFLSIRMLLGINPERPKATSGYHP